MKHRGRRAASAARYSIVRACAALLGCAPADIGLSPAAEDAAGSTGDAGGTSSADGSTTVLPLAPIVDGGPSDATAFNSGDGAVIETGTTSPCGVVDDDAPGDRIIVAATSGLYAFTP